MYLVDTIYSYNIKVFFIIFEHSYYKHIVLSYRTFFFTIIIKINNIKLINYKQNN